MYMSNKPALQKEQIVAAIQAHYNPSVSTIHQLVEGEESQAFWFADEESKKEYVVRVNPSVEGFKKDAYASKYFASNNIIIPSVVCITQIDDSHYLCISEKLQGKTLQDASAKELEVLVKKNHETLQYIQDIDISQSNGYGPINSDGNAPFSTWNAYLRSILPTEKDLEMVTQYISIESIQKIISVYESLLPFVSEERVLIHADYGANNVLTNGSTITGVIDWEEAMYGDSIYDMAIAYFWAPWLLCMEKQSEYWNDYISSIDNGNKRNLCYQLHIGISEIVENAQDGDIKMVHWLEKRCLEIINSIQ